MPIKDSAGERLPDLTHETSLERLRHEPIVSSVNEETVKLIASQVAPSCTRGELGHFLELCAHYDLDPFAHEAWCAKSKNGRLLIMVGRDGLRKIAQRNGLHVDGDVVRENDVLTVCRTPDGNRTISHSYGNPRDRGEVIGAWAEVREGGPTGRPMGYFYAPVDEYKPTSNHDYSPWQKQLGVMILAAAERQAIRQATPLGGLLAVGEDALVNENERRGISVGQGSGEARNIQLPEAVENVIKRATELGHEGLSDRATVEMAVADQPEAFVAEWVARAQAELSASEAEGVTDAEVVPDEKSVDQLRSDAAELHEQAQRAAEQGHAGDAKRLEAEALHLLHQADELEEAEA